MLDRADVDTDQIMPKQFLKRIERTGYGEFLFYDWFRSERSSSSRTRSWSPGRNFGSGSPREHAVWGLKDYGFDAVIAPSFSDIFYSNCTKNGLLPGRSSTRSTAGRSPAPERRGSISTTRPSTTKDGVFQFEIDEDIKHRLAQRARRRGA